MKVTVSVTLEADDDSPTVVHEVFSLERGALVPESLGLQLDEAKDLLAAVQEKMVNEQVRGALASETAGPECGRTPAMSYCSNAPGLPGREIKMASCPNPTCQPPGPSTNYAASCGESPLSSGDAFSSTVTPTRALGLKVRPRADRGSSFSLLQRPKPSSSHIAFHRHGGNTVSPAQG